ncbi:MAG: UvrD-helicase domain-containing protein [Chlamydiia bacterium]|nr:UvrD-helicase domain-containing protein [Chlamydiia bacterium]
MSTHLNPQQEQAVAHFEGPLLVIAGAGSGKTKVVTERCAELMRRGVEPHQILGLTFTNAAAKEMRERIQSQGYKSPLIATFHSFGAKVLRESAHLLGFSRNFVIYDEEDSLKVIRKVMKELEIDDKKGVAKELKAAISTKKNDLGLDEDESDPVFLLYQTKLKEYQALDFDDLLFLVVRLFDEHPDELIRYQRRYRFVLVDEVQDTNAAQYKILKYLVAKTGNLFMVGDPDQSIYSWRGANVDHILNFESQFPGGKVIRLEQNYRSTQTILRAANHLIENNYSRFEKKLWSELGEGELITVVELFTEKEEARYIARKIEDAVVSGVSYADIVVFYRTNAQSRPLEDQFLAWGIPYRIIGGMSFYQRREIKDILAFMRVALSPMDFVAIARTINLPKRGVGEATFEKLVSAAKEKGVTFFEILKSPEIKVSATAKKGLQKYVEIIEAIREAASGTVEDVIKTTLSESGYFDYLKEDPDSSQERKENLNELIAKAREFESDVEEPTLAAFLEELSLKSSADEGQEEPNSISLMTLHNGKGLEFNHVFIAGMEEGLLPHANSYGDDKAMEEERRLCYVGMTRAKRKLTLTGATFRYLWGTERDSRPSRFLREIPSEYLEKDSSF